MTRACLGLLISFIATSAAIAGDGRWELPAEPDAVVIELRYRDATTNRVTTALQLMRDGTFTAHPGTARRTRGRLQSAELNELLRSLLQESDALGLTTDGLRRQIAEESRRLRKPAHVQAADDVIVRLKLADRQHEFECPAPEVLRTRYPDLRDLERVCEIRRRLENLIAVAHVGGVPEAERLAALATAELRRHNGSNVRVTIRDLHTVRGIAGDLRQSQFVLSPSRSSGTTAQELHISVMESPGAAPRVTITHSATPL